MKYVYLFNSVSSPLDLVQNKRNKKLKFSKSLSYLIFVQYLLEASSFPNHESSLVPQYCRSVNSSLTPSPPCLHPFLSSCLYTHEHERHIMRKFTLIYFYLGLWIYLNHYGSFYNIIQYSITLFRSRWYIKIYKQCNMVNSAEIQTKPKLNGDVK